MKIGSYLNLAAGRRGLRAAKECIATFRCPSVLALLAVTVPIQDAVADALIVTQAEQASTIAEIFIEEHSIRVELEIGVRDLVAFRGLLPSALIEKLGLMAEPFSERLPRFFQEDLVFRADNGPPLAGRLTDLRGDTRIVRDEISGNPLPVQSDSEEVIVFASIEYPLAEQPATLSMSPPSGDGDYPPPTIGLVTYHRGLPVNDFRYWGREELLELDWSDPWYSRFHNRNLRRQYDAPLNVFLYVEPFEVRVEIIARPSDLQQWDDMGLERLGNIPVEMQEDIKRKAGEFLARAFTLEIDGVAVEPSLDRVNFLERTLRSSTVISPPRELDRFSATLGVIFVAPITNLPEEVIVNWHLFSDRIAMVPAAATDEAGPLPYRLQPDDNVLRWQNFLQNPTIPTLVDVLSPPPVYARAVQTIAWISGLLAMGLALGVLRNFHRTRPADIRSLAIVGVLFCVTAILFMAARQHAVTQERAQQIVAGLLHNVYHAFDFRDESSIYDVLDRSVTGELLTEIYLETRRGLELESQGGARAKVTSVELLEIDATDLNDNDGFLARCVWIVSGSVGHWGHLHQRTNQYLAELTVRPQDGSWKLSGVEILQEERL